ncbi:sugar phosphate isomerase/epimerase family protein [Thermodesulfobacteriota bacterium]
MLGISTCWWHNRAEQGEEIVREILELGLKGVELEYRLTGDMYAQMMKPLKASLKVLSIHNFFPKPEDSAVEKGSGDLFLLSSPNGDERSKAVAYTIRTMDHAVDLGTTAIILHLGRVDIPNLKTDFNGLYEKGVPGKEALQALLDDQRLLREKKQGKHMDAVLFSLEILNREAEKRGLRLGVENRYHLNEIPNFEEIGRILAHFQGGRIGYWHDVGHAGVQENLGILRQKELLDAYGSRLLGIHLHDVIGVEDHLPPGRGEMDYEEIRPYLKPSHIKILEIKSGVSREDLMAGIRKIQDLGMTL